ncbi:MAG: alanine:cation symporter family protein [Anaerovoracaceae bacterium]
MVGVATAVMLGGPGAVFWTGIAACFRTATKYSEGLLAVKFRVEQAVAHSGRTVLLHRKRNGQEMEVACECFVFSHAVQVRWV